jgi:hypothetical protein
MSEQPARPRIPRRWTLRRLIGVWVPGRRRQDFRARRKAGRAAGGVVKFGAWLAVTLVLARSLAASLAALITALAAFPDQLSHALDPLMAKVEKLAERKAEQEKIDADRWEDIRALARKAYNCPPHVVYRQAPPTRVEVVMPPPATTPSAPAAPPPTPAPPSGSGFPFRPR